MLVYVFAHEIGCTIFLGNKGRNPKLKATFLLTKEKKLEANACPIPPVLCQGGPVDAFFHSTHACVSLGLHLDGNHLLGTALLVLKLVGEA